MNKYQIIGLIAGQIFVGLGFGLVGAIYEKGEGKMLFDIIVNMMRGHGHIELKVD